MVSTPIVLLLQDENLTKVCLQKCFSWIRQNDFHWTKTTPSFKKVPNKLNDHKHFQHVLEKKVAVTAGPSSGRHKPARLLHSKKTPERQNNTKFNLPPLKIN